MRYLTFLVASLGLLAQEHSPQVQDRNSNPNQDRSRGQSRPADGSQSWTRGRLGSQGPLPGKPAELTGILIDASCRDRSSLNLTRPPDSQSADRAAPAQAAAATAPPDIAPHLTPDRAFSDSDSSCAVTAGARAFALLTTGDRLLNLDEGGNTLVLDALHTIPAGRAMLNGDGPSIKPRVTIRGKVQGDRLIVEKIVKL